VRAALLAALAAMLSAPALAQESRLSIDADKDGKPECTILISAEGYVMDDPAQAAQARADRLKVARALSHALDGSTDMQEKVLEACQRDMNGRGPEGRPPVVRVHVWRDHPSVGPGTAYPAVSDTPGSIALDLGDIEAIGNHFNPDSDPGLVKEIADHELTRVLAHEFDHLRDPPGWGSWGSRHGDPNPDEDGAPVRDENTVAVQLGASHQRAAYGSDLIPYEGFGDRDGAKAVLKFKDLIDRAGQVQRGTTGAPSGSRFG